MLWGYKPSNELLPIIPLDPGRSHLFQDITCAMPSTLVSDKPNHYWRRGGSRNHDAVIVIAWEVSTCSLLTLGVGKTDYYPYQSTTLGMRALGVCSTLSLLCALKTWCDGHLTLSVDPSLLLSRVEACTADDGNNDSSRSKNIATPSSSETSHFR